MEKLAKFIAFYLPQFHPIPENDQWWGKGFTEWTNVVKAKPLFLGHYQPHIPTDLGFYDLRVPEIRIAQAEMAKEYGIEAFCYYHYWFAGKRLLERPFNEVLESGKPDLPFCLCWANQTWTGIWHGCPDRILIEQTYQGIEDYEAHFKFLLKAFKDKRYLTVDGKPLFIIFKPTDTPVIKQIIDFWRELAKKSGLTGLYLVAVKGGSEKILQEYGFDAVVRYNFPLLYDQDSWYPYALKRLNRLYEEKIGKPRVYLYKKICLSIIEKNKSNVLKNYPCLFPNWDNTPRSGPNGIVFHGSTPELFRLQVKKAIDIIKDEPAEHRLIFIKSWNEWAEGNHLEPDLRFGKGYLEVLKEEIYRSS
jgi:hypothetical protein